MEKQIVGERDELHALMRFELVGGDTQSADQPVKQRPALDRRREERRGGKGKIKRQRKRVETEIIETHQVSVIRSSIDLN